MMDVKVLASGSSGNCYRVSDGSTTILLDAGISLKRIMKGCDYNLSKIEACFVTHCHGDHSKAVGDLLRLGIPVYMTHGEAEEYEKRKEPWERRLRLKIAEMKGDPKKYLPVEVGTLMVLPFATNHDTPEPVGFLVWSSKTRERLLYFTDTFYLWNRFPQFDYLIGEVNYDAETLQEHIESKETGAYRAKRLFSSHMSLDNFLKFLRANDLTRLKKIWICHMSDDHGNEERIKRAVQEETGVEVEVC